MTGQGRARRRPPRSSPAWPRRARPPAPAGPEPGCAAQRGQCGEASSPGAAGGRGPTGGTPPGTPAWRTPDRAGAGVASGRGDAAARDGPRRRRAPQRARPGPPDPAPIGQPPGLPGAAPGGGVRGRGAAGERSLVLGFGLTHAAAARGRPVAGGAPPQARRVVARSAARGAGGARPGRSIATLPQAGHTATPSATAVPQSRQRGRRQTGSRASRRARGREPEGAGHGRQDRERERPGGGVRGAGTRANPTTATARPCVPRASSAPAPRGPGLPKPTAGPRCGCLHPSGTGGTAPGPGSEEQRNQDVRWDHQRRPASAFLLWWLRRYGAVAGEPAEHPAADLPGLVSGESPSIGRPFPLITGAAALPEGAQRTSRFRCSSHPHPPAPSAVPAPSWRLLPRRLRASARGDVRSLAHPRHTRRGCLVLAALEASGGATPGRRTRWTGCRRELRDREQDVLRLEDELRRRGRPLSGGAGRAGQLRARRGTPPEARRARGAPRPPPPVPEPPPEAPRGCRRRREEEATRRRASPQGARPPSAVARAERTTPAGRAPRSLPSLALGSLRSGLLALAGRGPRRWPRGRRPPHPAGQATRR